MTAGKGPDKQAARHVYGPRSLAALVPMVARAAYRKRSPAASHLLADWEAIVGPHLASVSAPRKLFAGTLSIAATGPVAMELQHAADVLMQRINAHLGERSVTRLRFVQDFSPTPRVAPPAPPAAATEAAGRAVAHLPDGPLREALLRLGATVLAPRRRV